MASLEDEVRDLREKNSELAQEVQFWKVSAGQKEKEKLDLMKEVNELRLKLSVLRSSGTAQLRKLDSALQSAGEEALSHLVQASGAVARTFELCKQFIHEREELESVSPRFSTLGGTPSSEKVNRVPPLLIGGQSIQPVVALSRTMFNNRSVTRSPNQNSGVTHRVMSLPMHILQDVSIPLTRIDMSDLQMNASAEDDPDSADDHDLEEDLAEEENLASTGEGNESSMNQSVRLDAVIEDDEPEMDEEDQRLTTADNPLEGPSWLLDRNTDENAAGDRDDLEPDSTTACERGRSARDSDDAESEQAPAPTLAVAAAAPAHAHSLAFTPTVRRRKRSASPRPAPAPAHRHSNSDRVLKVMVAKMRFSDEDPGGSGDCSHPERQTPTLVKSPKRSTIETNTPTRPTERSLQNRSSSKVDLLPRRPVVELDRSAVDLNVTPRRSVDDRSPGNRSGRDRVGGRKRKIEENQRSPRFDAPSPKGATDARVIVSETLTESRMTDASSHESLQESVDNRSCRSHSRSADKDSDSGDDTRRRRARKPVSYKEKPLNRKLRR